jgi:serine protease Do
MKRLALPGAVCAFALVASAASAGEVEDWIREQAKEHRAYLEERTFGRQGPGAGSAAGHLWMERAGPVKGLEGFVAQTSLAPLVRAVGSGVVNISTTLEEPRPGETTPPARRSLGSGFVINPAGFVVTNNHVVEAARAILVQLSDGREFTATVVGRDASTDVALLRLEGSPGNLPHVFLGDSDKLQVGDWVVAIGNPFGLDHSVSHGMISAKERVLGLGIFDDFIQTDALINPGNSGGPLFNMRGEVVGVNSAIISQGQGIGFAVPINMVKELIPNLRENGRLARGWLGVNIVDGPSGKGAVVTEVIRGSPAALAGLVAGDRVLSVNDRLVENFQQLLRKVSFVAPGSRAKLMVERDGRMREVMVTLAERPAPDTLHALAAAEGRDVLGMILGTGENGVLVSGVLPGSAAERAGLRAGDLITEINKKPVRREEEVKESLAQNPRKTALVRILRGDAVRYVAVDVDPSRSSATR